MTNDSPGTPSEETSPEQVPAPPHESMGQYLQRGRIHKNISRETVAEATCIHASTLLALEEDDYEKLPADVFTRGFIKIYANQLGLDAQKALHLYQPGAKKRSGIDERSGRHQPILPGELLAEASPLTFGRQFLIFLLILLVAWLGFLFFQSDTFNAEGPKQPPTVTGQTTPPPAMEPTAAITVPAEQPLTPPATVAPQQVAPPIVDTAGNTTGVDRGGITPDGRKITLQQPQAASPATPPASEAPRAAVTAPAATAAPGTPAQFAYVVKADFSELTWMTVSIDNGPQRDFTFRPGERWEWRANQNITLHVGNAGGVHLTLNDKKLAPLGDSGKSVRLTLPTGTATTAPAAASR